MQNDIKISYFETVEIGAIRLSEIDRNNKLFFLLLTTLSLPALNQNVKKIEKKIKAISKKLNLKKVSLHFSTNVLIRDAIDDTKSSISRSVEGILKRDNAIIFLYSLDNLNTTKFIEVIKLKLKGNKIEKK